MDKRGCISTGLNRNTPETKFCDVVVVGVGTAGMTVALSLNSKLRVVLISKGDISESSTYKAQGGVAVAAGSDDSIEDHMTDTLRVGKGLCREEAVQVLVEEGPAALDYLQMIGTDFNLDGDNLALAREAGHSRNRVVHYFDFTGKHIAETLAAEVVKRDNIERLEQCFLVDILTEGKRCCGCKILQNGTLSLLCAPVVVIATGGYSGLFSRSTNTESASGDGIAAAYRAGAVIADMEFVQFHPTAFYADKANVLLLTEALRGEGAVMLNEKGERFMLAYHPNAELAPRDTVARAISEEMSRQDGRPVYLDARQLGREYLSDRFPQVYGGLAESGYYMEKDLIPIAPAAHYTIGGIKTDLWGRTNIDNLYACGETAATGVHGANRLASNSLLEGVVFGRRVADQVNRDFPASVDANGCGTVEGNTTYGWDINLAELQAALDRTAGVVRRGEDMAALLNLLYQQRNANYGDIPAEVRAYQAINAQQLAELLLEAALLRQESRGAHFRDDFPENNDVEYKKHILQQWGRKAVLV